MKRLAAMTLTFFALGMAGDEDASVIYRNAVGLKPGEFARFVARDVIPIPHTVRVVDRRSGERVYRTVSRLDTRANARFRGLRVRIRFANQLTVRVANGSAHGRRVRVRVTR